MTTRDRLLIKPERSEILSDFSELIESIVSARISNYDIDIVNQCIVVEYSYFAVSPRKSATSLSVLKTLESSEWVSAAYASYNDTSDSGNIWFFKPLVDENDMVDHTPEDMIALLRGFDDNDEDESVINGDYEYSGPENREVPTVVELISYSPFEELDKARSELENYELPSSINLT